MSLTEQQRSVIILVALAAAAVVAAVIAWCRDGPPDAVYRRGAKLIPAAEAGRLAAARPGGRFVPPAGFPGLAVGGLRLSVDFAWTGIALLGEPGSGKSLLTLQYLDSVLDLICRLDAAGRRGEVRAFVFDAKRDVTARILARLPRHIPVRLALPLDARASAWRVAVDVDSPAEAAQLAYALIPEGKGEGENAQFFRLAAVALLTATIIGLIRKAPRRWKWTDLNRLSRTRRRLRWFLRQWPDTRDVAAQYLSARSAGDVVATLGAHLDRYAAVFGCWDRAAGAFSLREFLAGDGVVVLGLDDSVAEALKPLYALMVRRLTDLLLALNDPTRPTFLILDEYALFGKGDLLPLALKGRGAAASLMVTAQDVLSLEAVHGEKEARALLGSLLTRGVLRVTSEATARFASDAIGEQEVYQYTTNLADGPGGRTATRAEAVVRRPVVLPDEIKGLPLPDWAAGVVTGYFALPGVGVYRAGVRFRDGAPPPPPGPPAPDYLPRPAADQTVSPFDRHDLARLGLPDNPLTRKVFGVTDAPA